MIPGVVGLERDLVELVVVVVGGVLCRETGFMSG